MSYFAVAVIIIFLLCCAALFFALSAITLRSFSRGKLQEAFKEINGQNRIEQLVENAEKLIMSCCFYRLVINAAILLLVLSLFATDSLRFVDYLAALVIASLLFSVFSLAIPHAWAKYAGEKTLCRTYKLLMFFAVVASPSLYLLRFFDGLTRRLAGVAETTAAEQQEEKQEEFLTGLEQHRIEGAVDEEEQEMIENVLELSDSAADEIMTPRTDIIAIEVNSDLNSILETITTAGHTRLPVYEENIDNITGFIYAKDLLSHIG
ncbi:MAG: CNNM domain-containing protein, partial [Planctomycetota bacterium]